MRSTYLRRQQHLSWCTSWNKCFTKKNRKFVVSKFVKLCDELITKQNEWDRLTWDDNGIWAGAHLGTNVMDFVKHCTGYLFLLCQKKTFDFFYFQLISNKCQDEHWVLFTRSWQMRTQKTQFLRGIPNFFIAKQKWITCTIVVAFLVSWQKTL